MCNMSGASCAPTRSISPGARAGAKATIPISRPRQLRWSGLYLKPPENAPVRSLDEKPSIQALERSQGYLKMRNGGALNGQSHDYTRHGTTTLFAAFDIATGKV